MRSKKMNPEFTRLTLSFQGDTICENIPRSTLTDSLFKALFQKHWNLEFTKEYTLYIRHSNSYQLLTQSLYSKHSHQDALDILIDTTRSIANDIQHTWISKQNTFFSVDEILCFSSHDFRYFVFGSRRMKDIISQIFSTDFKVPDVLVSDMLMYIMVTSDYELLSRVIEIKDISVQISLLCYKEIDGDVYDEELFRKFRSSPKYGTFLYLLLRRVWRRSVWVNVVRVILSDFNGLIVDEYFGELFVSNRNNSIRELSLLLHYLVDDRQAMNRLKYIKLVIETWNKRYKNTVKRIDEKNEVKMIKVLFKIRDDQVIMKEFLMNTVLPKYYSKELIECIGNDVKLLTYVTMNTNVNNELVFNNHFNLHQLITVICSKRTVSQNILKNVFLYSYEFKCYGVYEQDAIYTAILNNKSVQLNPRQYLMISCFIEFCREQDISNVCQCSLALAQKIGLPEEVYQKMVSYDHLTRYYLACNTSIGASLRSKLIKCDDKELSIIAKAFSDSLDFQKEVLSISLSPDNLGSREYLVYLSCLAKNNDAFSSVLAKLSTVECDRDWLFKRDIAQRSYLNAKLVGELLNSSDIDVLINLSKNESIKFTKNQIYSLGNIAHTNGAVDKFSPSLMLIHKNFIDLTDDEKRSLFYSYQSQIRMNLLQYQKDIKLYDGILKIWVEDSDPTVIFSLIEHIPKLSDDIVELIVKREADSEETKENLIIKKIIDIRLLSNRNIIVCLLYESKNCADYVLKKFLKFRRFLRDYAFIEEVLVSILKRWKKEESIMKKLSDLLLILPKYRKKDDFINLLFEFCNDKEVSTKLVVPLIHTVDDERIFDAVFARTDLSEDDLYRLYLREVCKNGYDGEFLLKLAKRDNLPQNLIFTLSLLKSKLGRYSLNYIQKNRDLEILDNELFPCFFLEKNIPLNQAIIKYYLTYESQYLLPLLKSSILDSDILSYFFEKILVQLNYNDKHPVIKYIDTFITSLRTLCGDVEISIYNLNSNKLTSKLIEMTIDYAKYGVKFGKLNNFLFEKLGLVSKCSRKTIDLFAAFQILFEDFLEKEEDTISRGNASQSEQSGKSSNDDDDDDDLYKRTENRGNIRRTFNVNDMTFLSFSEMKKSFSDIILSSSSFSYVNDFFMNPKPGGNGYLKFDYVKRCKLISVPSEYAHLFCDGFEELFNKKLMNVINSVFTVKLLRYKNNLTKDDLIYLIDKENHTVKKIHSKLKEFNKDNRLHMEKEIRKLEELIKKGVTDDYIKDFRGMEIELVFIGDVYTIFKHQRQIEDCPYIVFYRYKSLFPINFLRNFNTKLNNLISFYGKPADDNFLSIGYYYSKHGFEKELKWLETKDISLLDKICNSENRINFKGTSLEYVFEKEDSNYHKCNLLKLENNIWDLLVDGDDNLLDKFIGDLKSIFEDLKSIHNFEIVKKSKDAMRSSGIFDKKLLGRLYFIERNRDNILKMIKEERDMSNFVFFISPFKKLVNIRYMCLKSSNGLRLIQSPNAMFFIERFFGKEIDLKMGSFPLYIEAVEFLLSHENRIKVVKDLTIADCKLSFSRRIWERDQKDVAKYLFLNLEEVEKICTKKIFDMYKCMIEKAFEQKDFIMSRCKLILLKELSKTEKEEIEEIVSVRSGKGFVEQHPLLLDENMMPMIDPQNPNHFLRDITQALRNLPVEYAQRNVRMVPKLVDVSLEIKTIEQWSNKLELIDLKIIIENIKKAFDEEHKNLRNMVFTTLNNNRFKLMFKKAQNLLKGGIKVKIPRSRKEFFIKPDFDFYEHQINLISETKYIKNPLDIIKSFQFIINADLPKEIIKLLELINMMGTEEVGEELYFSKLFHIGFVVQIMKSERNYHDLLTEPKSMHLKALCFQLSKEFFPKLIKYQKQYRGTIMLCFKICDGGLLFFSSNFDSIENRWMYYVHYNNNACATCDFNTCISMCFGDYPVCVMNGLNIIDLFISQFGEVVVLNFSRERIQLIKTVTTKEMNAVVRESNWENEVSGGGRSAGTINYYSDKLNHLQKEAVLCNESPFVGIKYDPQCSRVSLLKTIDEMKEDLILMKDKFKYLNCSLDLDLDEDEDEEEDDEDENDLFIIEDVNEDHEEDDDDKEDEDDDDGKMGDILLGMLRRMERNPDEDEDDDKVDDLFSLD